MYPIHSIKIDVWPHIYHQSLINVILMTWYLAMQLTNWTEFRVLENYYDYYYFRHKWHYYWSYITLTRSYLMHTLYTYKLIYKQSMLKWNPYRIPCHTANSVWADSVSDFKLMAPLIDVHGVESIFMSKYKHQFLLPLGRLYYIHKSKSG